MSIEATRNGRNKILVEAEVHMLARTSLLDHIMVSASSALAIAGLAAGVTVMLVAHVLVIYWALRRDAGGRPHASRGAEEWAGAGACAGAGQGLSAGEFETLPCYDFKAAAGGGGGCGDCAVCLEVFEAGDRCRRLPRCKHSFHAACVDSWLEKSRCCPVCRADVVVPAAKGELVKAAEPMEMAERTSTATLEVVVET